VFFLNEKLRFSLFSFDDDLMLLVCCFVLFCFVSAPKKSMAAWFLRYDIYSAIEKVGHTVHDALSYDHAEWVYYHAPGTPEATEKLRWFTIAVCLASIFSDTATILFAILAGQLIFTSLTCFINHYYLFFLLATLMSFYCNCSKDNIRNRAGWIHAIRGQVVVVYAFASLWKFDSDWLSGYIVSQIFLNFEEQGVNRGIPWSRLYASYPQLFLFIAISGVFLDTMLFLVLMFLRPGHKLQRIGLVFHGFTAFTMSQRIGISFPLTMIAAGLAFQRCGEVEKDQEWLGGDVLSHFQWLQLQMQLWFRPNHFKTKQTIQEQGVKKRKLLFPLLFLLAQWLIPLRMPLVSHGEFKHTFEGYRWSWTMMLHEKKSAVAPGLSYMTLRPTCGAFPFPNPQAQEYRHMDAHSFPYELWLYELPRSLAVAQMFPRQMPKFAKVAYEVIGGDQACPAGMTVTTSYFSSTNDGPFHRIINPTSDILEVHRNHASLPWSSKLWYAILDKAPPGQEFVLRGTDSVDLPLGRGPKNGKDEVTFVDRSPCLQADPIRVNSRGFFIEFDTAHKANYRLQLRGCSDINLEECKEKYISKGEIHFFSAMRTITIGINQNIDLGVSCSETNKEDVVIKLTKLS